MANADSVTVDGREVRLTVSIGKGGQTVPDLAGTGYRDAQVALARAGLRVGQLAYAPSERVPKDQVLASDPEPETQVEPGADSVQCRLLFGPAPQPPADSPGTERKGGDFQIRVSQFFRFHHPLQCARHRDGERTVANKQKKTVINQSFFLFLRKGS